LCADLDGVLVDVVAVHKVEVTVVQVVRMIVVTYRRVSATGAVEMAVLPMNTMLSSH
jgi:hypothetical protein